MSFAQFLSVIRARKWIVLAVLMLTVITTVGVSLLLPKQYTATASVVVDFKPDPISAVMFGGMAPPAFMATQVDIIQSERVALRVVRNLRLAESSQIRQQWQEDTQGEGTIEQWLISLFKRQMDVVPSRESSVIAVTYKAPDPRFAAGLANAFVQAYVDTAVELRVDPAKQYSTFFEGRAKELRDNLEKAQSKLSAFQKANGIVATDERLDIENARLNELSSQLVAIQAITAESNSRQVQANSTSGDRMQEVLNNPVVGSLKADLSRGEARLKELSTRYGDNHPQVIEAKANMAELRSRLDAEVKRVTGGVTVTSTINRSREQQLRAELDAQRVKVLRLKAVRDEGMVLARDVDSAQRAYEAVQTRLTQTSLESQTTQSNINVLTQAVPPVEPSSPKVALNGVLSLFIGLLLAVGIAMLLEMLDRRVRAPDDVVAELGLPILGVMPGAEPRRLLGARRDTAMQTRLLAPVAASRDA